MSRVEQPEPTPETVAVIPAVPRRPDRNAALEPGARIGGYLVKGLLASGGFGAVYEVEHVVLGRRAALKLLHPWLCRSAEIVIRFEREARAANLIRHPNVVDVYEFGEHTGGRPYFVMELLEGRDLAAHLAAEGAMSLAELVPILEPLASALAAAHAQGIVHRDLKPSNVFLDQRGGATRVVLCDFGVAKLLGSGPSLTRTGDCVGTPSVMAPEQIRGEAVDARTDVYGLANLVFYALTRRVPYEEGSKAAAQYQHLHARRPRISRWAAVPRALDDVIIRAMSVEPADRHPGVHELLADLRGVLRIAAPPTTLASAVGVHLDVAAPEHAWDDVEAILEVARTQLAAAGFLRVLETGNSSLHIRALEDDTRHGLARAAAAVEAATLGREVTATITIHVDEATVDGGRVGGALTRLDWTAAEGTGGVRGTPAAVRALGLEVAESLPTTERRHPRVILEVTP